MSATNRKVLKVEIFLTYSTYAHLGIFLLSNLHVQWLISELISSELISSEPRSSEPRSSEPRSSELPSSELPSETQETQETQETHETPKTQKTQISDYVQMYVSSHHYFSFLAEQ